MYSTLTCWTKSFLHCHNQGWTILELHNSQLFEYCKRFSSMNFISTSEVYYVTLNSNGGFALLKLTNVTCQYMFILKWCDFVKKMRGCFEDESPYYSLSSNFLKENGVSPKIHIWSLSTMLLFIQIILYAGKLNICLSLVLNPNYIINVDYTLHLYANYIVDNIKLKKRVSSPKYIVR